MTDEELQAIRKRCEEATPGPWIYAVDDEGVCMGWVKDTRIFEEPLFAVCGDSAQQYMNAKFAAHARTDIPALLAEVDRLRGVQSVKCIFCDLRFPTVAELRIHSATCELHPTVIELKQQLAAAKARIAELEKDTEKGLSVVSELRAAQELLLRGQLDDDATALLDACISHIINSPTEGGQPLNYGEMESLAERFVTAYESNNEVLGDGSLERAAANHNLMSIFDAEMSLVCLVPADKAELMVRLLNTTNL